MAHAGSGFVSLLLTKHASFELIRQLRDAPSSLYFLTSLTSQSLNSPFYHRY